MEIRKLASRDRAVVALFAREHAKALYPALRMDVDKIASIVRETSQSDKHYARVAVTDGNVVCGTLVGVTGDNLWAQRKYCGVVLWYAVVPGVGAALLRDFKTWVLAQRSLRVAGFQVDCDVDARAWKLAERIGFKRHGGAYLLYTREERLNGPVL